MCQRYNLKANHNRFNLFNPITCGVYQCVKDTIWKQITTSGRGGNMQISVFISVSKIQFESKSQLIVWFTQCSRGCLSVCQRYNLKANHNTQSAGAKSFYGVYQCVKDTIWKQITTFWMSALFGSWVFISVSKIQFESKSQLIYIGVAVAARCLSVCQRYNLKANHNPKALTTEN